MNAYHVLDTGLESYITLFFPPEALKSFNCTVFLIKALNPCSTSIY